MAYILSNGGVIINDSREIVNAGVVTATGFVGDGSSLSGIVTVSDGSAIINDASVSRNLNVTGITTLSYLTAGDVNVGGALTVAGNLDVTGDISFDEVIGTNLSISGVSTLGTVQISSGIVTATSGVVTYYGDGSNLTGVVAEGSIGLSTNGNYVGAGFTTVDIRTGSGLVVSAEGVTGGVGTITYSLTGIPVDGGDATFRNLEATGIATVAGDLNANGNIVGDTATNISGINSVTAVTYYGDGSNLTGLPGADGTDLLPRNIQASGIATVAGDINANGNIVGDTATNISGINSVTAGVYYGDGSNLTGVGITEVNGIDVLPRNLQVSGLSTFVGVATFQNDLYVGGDLNVLGDIVYDEISGRNLSISGITTLGTVKIESGIVTATTGVVTYYGDGSNLTGVGLTQVSGIDVLPRNLQVSGLSTFVGVATFQSDLYASAFIGVGTDLLDLPPASISTSTSPSVRRNGDALQPGDLWFDSSELRQYVWYDDKSGITTTNPAWVPSSPQPTFPNLSFAGDTGSSEFDIASSTFNLNGTANQIVSSVVGLGSTVTFALATDVTLTRNLTTAGIITAAEYYGDGSNLTGVVAAGSIGLSTNGNYVGAGFTTVNIVTGPGLTVSGEGVTGGVGTITYNLTGIPVAGGDAEFRNLQATGITTLTGDLNANGNIVGDTATNISGINSVTAVTYYGDGSNLSGVGLDTSGFYKVAGIDAGITTVTSIDVDGAAGNRNTFFGGEDTVTAGGQFNTLVGSGIGTQVTGFYNTFVGAGAGEKATTADESVYIGVNAGLANTDGRFNTYLGVNAALNRTGGDQNVVIGRNAAGGGSTGPFNNSVIIGHSAAPNFAPSDPTSANGSIAIGALAGNSLTTGVDNVFIGQQAGQNINTGGGNVIIGDFNTTFNNAQFGAVYVGYNMTGGIGEVLAIGQGSGRWLSGNSSFQVTFPNALTASSDINANGNIVGDTATNISGINSVTAVVYYGDGSNLTGVGLTEVSGIDVLPRNLQVSGISTLTGVANAQSDLLGGRNFSVVGLSTLSGDARVGAALTVVGDVTANDFNSTSDIRKKENIVEIVDALDKLTSLRGVTFDWKDGSGSSGGVIAQDVEKVLPTLVKGDDDKTVIYNGIIGLLVAAVKELAAEVEELKK